MRGKMQRARFTSPSWLTFISISISISILPEMLPKLASSLGRWTLAMTMWFSSSEVCVPRKSL
jgi:hypothetical protein